MKIICPNLRNEEVKKQFYELKNALSEETAYYVWSCNNGDSLDYAPNGAQSKLFSDLLDYYKGDRVSAIIAKAKTYSPSFRNWFGDWLSEDKENVSKVVDENNEPLIVYHGTENEFDVFSKELRGATDPGDWGLGFYFSPRKDVSEMYGSNIKPVYLSIKNPVPKEKLQMTEDSFGREKVKSITLREKIQEDIAVVEFSIKGYEEQLYGNDPDNEHYREEGSILNKMVKQYLEDYKNKLRNLQTQLQEKSKKELDFDINKKWNDDVEEINKYDGIIPNINSKELVEENYEIIAKDPNQIKSIDNRGTYSVEDNNIYQYAVDTIENRIDGEEAKKVFSQSAKETIANMIDSEMFFSTDDQINIANQLYNSIGDNVIIKFNNIDGYAQYQNNTITINPNIFNRFNNKDIGRILLHELLHHFTILEYKNNKAFKNKIDQTYNKINNIFPSNKYNRKESLYYGLTNPQEFISEVYTNSSFRDIVAKKNMSLWRRLLSNFLSTLHLDKLANKVQQKGIDNTTSIINEIQKIINNRYTDYRSNTLGDGIFKYTIDNHILNELNEDARKINEKIIKGLKASYKSLKSRDKSPVLLAKLQQTIDQYELDFQKNDDLLILTNFIQRASEQFKPVLKLIRKAYLDTTILSNDEILNFKNDFLDFYGPMCEEINKKLFLQDYFADLDEEQLNVLSTNMDLINRAYQEISGKYEKILNERASEIISEMGQMYGVPTEDIERYINEDMQHTVGDINFITQWLRTTRNLKDFALRLSYRSVADINNQVQNFANDKAQQLIRQFSKIKKEDQLLYFEKDKDGKTTGYLVRDKRYGEFKRDYNTFINELDQKYGVVDGNYYVLNEDDYFKYIGEKENWLESHCERKFKKEYYKLYNQLKPTTRLRMKSLNGEIQSIIELVTKDDGVHLEELSDKDWTRLDNLYQVKKNLSNLYNFDGTEKVGEARDIAEDLTNFYEKLGSNKIKSLKMSTEEVDKILQQKEKELSPELFVKWQTRNITYQFSDEFLELIKSETVLTEHQEEYDDLINRRSKLMNLGRNNNLPRTEASLLTEQVKQEIKDLDERIESLRYVYSEGGNSNFNKYAKMITTPQYKIDEEKAKAQGDKAYKEWYDKSHFINSRGKEVVVSYYRQLVPKDNKYLEIRLSRMNQELDKNSSLINPDYDFENPEYYQPSKTLYDNTAALKKATSTPEKKEIYDLICSTIKEANDKIPFLSRRDMYKLPQMTGDIVDFTMRGNKFWKGITEYSLDGVLVNNDDADYALDNFTQKPDGSQLKFIPTHYLEMLKNPEHISRNLVGMLTEYSKMAENYRLKNERISKYEVLAEQMANRTFTIPDIFRHTISERKGDTTNTYKKFVDFIDMNMYGQLNQPITSKPFGKNKDKQVSFSKIINAIKKYASSSNLGWNLTAITKSLFQGLHKSTVEALSGRYFNAQNYYKLLAKNIFNIPKMIHHLGDSKYNDLTLALLERAGIARNLEDKTNSLQYNRFFRNITKNLIWGGWSAIDYLVKAPVVEAIYADYKYIPQDEIFMSRRKFIREKFNDDWKKGSKEFDRISTFTLLDVYKVKNGIPIIKDQYKKYKNAIENQDLQNSVINTARFITNRIDGVLSQEDKTKFMTNAFGACVMMHRSFFAVNMEDNVFAEYQYNPYIEDYYEAKYRSTFKVLWNWMSNLFSSVAHTNPTNLNKLDSAQFYNFKRTMIQLSLIGMYMLLVSLWLKPEANKDKDSYAKNFIGYCIDAATFEERAEYNPFDLFNQIKSPSAAIAPVENITNMIKLFDPINFENNFKEINKGPYKGMERWQRTLIKSTPGLRGIWESKDPRSKWEYLESQLDK